MDWPVSVSVPLGSGRVGFERLAALTALTQLSHVSRLAEAGAVVFVARRSILTRRAQLGTAKAPVSPDTLCGKSTHTYKQ